MKIKVEDIIIENRIRKNLGDLTPLMESIQNYGLMNPVVINKNRKLIAGHRRLESVKRLGWSEVEAIVMEPGSQIAKLEMEIEENVQRRNLSSEELADAYLILDKMKNPNIFLRIFRSIRDFFKNIFYMIFRKNK
ncbi:MAG: ParB N-terminal domain-containing protein [Spirochaetia bacterium]